MIVNLIDDEFNPKFLQMALHSEDHIFTRPDWLCWEETFVFKCQNAEDEPTDTSDYGLSCETVERKRKYSYDDNNERQVNYGEWDETGSTEPPYLQDSYERKEDGKYRTDWEPVKLPYVRRHPQGGLDGMIVEFVIDENGEVHTAVAEASQLNTASPSYARKQDGKYHLQAAEPDDIPELGPQFRYNPYVAKQLEAERPVESEVFRRLRQHPNWCRTSGGDVNRMPVKRNQKLPKAFQQPARTKKVTPLDPIIVK